MPEHHTFDKSRWAHGAWFSEPDRAEWIDDGTGLQCSAVRGPLGAWFGYVEIPAGHPWFEQEIDLGQPVLREVRADVIGAGDEGWWIGFGCDKPGEMKIIPFLAEVEAGDLRPRAFLYRTLEYVKTECHRLAEVVVASSDEPRKSRP